MTQDFDRVDHLGPTTPEERINKMVRSKEDRRRRQPRALKEKAEDEREKDRKKKSAYRLMLSDPELIEDEKDDKQDDKQPDEDAQIAEAPGDNNDEEANNDTSDGHIDLKA